MGDRAHDLDAMRAGKKSVPRRQATRDVVGSGEATSAQGRIMALQRVAGNAATTRWLQASPDERGERRQPEVVWVGSIKGNLGDNGSLYHTLNNFGDEPLSYLLRIRNTGDAMVSLETQYRFRDGELQRAWIARSATRGQTAEVTNGLPPRSSLHLRFFGERDHTRPEQTSYEGTLEVRRKK